MLFTTAAPPAATTSHSLRSLDPTPRSSSLSSQMGHSFSRPAHPQSPPSSSSTSNPSITTSSTTTMSITSPTPTGGKLRRAFAAHRKKSDDGKGIVKVHNPTPSSSSSGRNPIMMIPSVFTGKRTAASTSLPPQPPSPPPPRLPPKSPPVLTHTSPLDATRADQRNSLIPLSPGITSALAFMRKTDERGSSVASGPENDSGNEFGRDFSLLRQRSSSSSSDKEDWRKSDATVTATSTNMQRPVLVADSVQSTFTVVPTQLDITDVASARWHPQRGPSSNNNHTRRGSVDTTDERSSSSSPSPSPSPSPAPSLSSASSSGSVHGPRPAVSNPNVNLVTSPGNSNNHGRFPAWSTATADPIATAQRGYPPNPSSFPHHPHPMHAAHSHSSGHQPSSSSSSSSSSSRQPAISLTGFAPAGLAKRAVEKMGRAWGGIATNSNTNVAATSSHSGGSGYLSSSSSSGSVSVPPSHSRTSTHEHFQPQQYYQTGKVFGKPRRTQNAPSGAWSVASSSVGSSAEADAASVHQQSTSPTGASNGPHLGQQVRGPIMASGVVFGRDLRTCTKETAIGVGRPHLHGYGYWDDGVRNWEGRDFNGKDGYLKTLEKRMVPAIVVRCAQHLLLWGVQEEGLFRVSGRPFHVSKLRGEFDSGADYDMSECTPGDLDPHAVASVFKAYLRELPEPILTRALLPYFDAAMNAETDSADNQPTTSPPPTANATRVLKGPPLPSSVRNGIPNPMLRKPPSLSTLAMPSFSGMKPPSKSLLNALRTLIRQLPQENRDLIRIVAELIKATARESKATKMPLSNLLLVFCPSLNMNPPLLRVLCEGEGIWGVEGGDGKSAIPDVLDIRAKGSVGVAEEEAGDEKTSKEAPAVPEVISVSTTVPVDGESPVGEDSSLSLIHSGRSSTDTAMSVTDGAATPSPSISPDPSKSSTPVADIENPPDHPHALPALSSSAESVDTLSTSTSSCDPSLPSNFASLPDIDPFHKLQSYSSLDLATTLSLPMISESLPPPSPQQRRRQLSPRDIRKISISSPISGPVQFPGTSSQPVTPLMRPRSIPHISLSSFNIQPASPPLEGAPESPTTSNALTPVRSRGGGLMKPSLQLLFAKPASSVPSATSLISFSPYAVQQQQQQPSPLQQRPASDSSVSTPTTAYTAQSSTTHLPPVLDTPIDSSPICLGMGLDGEEEQEQEKDEKEKKENVNSNLFSPSPPQDRTLTKLDIPSTLVSNTTSHTPIADLFLTPSSSLQSLLFPSSTAASTSPPPIRRSTSSTSNFINDATTVTSTTQPLRLRQPKPKTSTASLDRLGAIRHLGGEDEDNEEREDWTKSVLLAAELNADWLFQRGGEKPSEVHT